MRFAESDDCVKI